MSAIPLWLLGRHVTSVVAALQEASNTDGTLQNLKVGTPVATDTATLVGGSPAVGLIDECEIRKSKVSENINSVVRTQAHHVAISEDDSIILTEILRQGSSTCLLANLWFSTTTPTAGYQTTRIVSFTFTRGGNKWTGFLKMTDYAESFSRGKNVGRMTLQMVDPGAANIAYGTA